MTKLERDALRQVNRIRQAEGRKALKRLPEGIPGEPYACPIARALDHGRVGVGGDNVSIPLSKLAAYLRAGLKLQDETISLQMPKAFDKFIAWFDSQADSEAADSEAQALSEEN